MGIWYKKKFILIIIFYYELNVFFKNYFNISIELIFNILFNSSFNFLNIIILT
jgi:hypothetical protein